jgi:type 1 glutamine amidotransferase
MRKSRPNRLFKSLTRLARICLCAAPLLPGVPAMAAPFKVLMIAAVAPDHTPMTGVARTALAKMGADNGFTVDYSADTSLINDTDLARYQVLLQMHLAPFEMSLKQRAAFENFVRSGKGWVGIHGAGLIIPSSYVKRNYPDWELYARLFGGITYVTHPALQNGTVLVEDRGHPATRNLPASFAIKDEWYEWDKSPRPGPNIRVLAKADEKSYSQVKSMGDHPLIWTDTEFQRALYIGIGHDSSDWSNANFNTLVRDALIWAASGTPTALNGGRARVFAQPGPASMRGGTIRVETAGGADRAYRVSGIPAEP